jgi:hypothetical protein
MELAAATQKVWQLSNRIWSPLPWIQLGLLLKLIIISLVWIHSGHVVMCSRMDLDPSFTPNTLKSAWNWQQLPRKHRADISSTLVGYGGMQSPKVKIYKAKLIHCTLFW